MHAKLGDDVNVRLREGGAAVVQMATDGVVMIATDDVVVVALGVNRERDRVSTDDPLPAAGSIELVGRAQEAVNAAAKALRWVGRRDLA